MLFNIFSFLQITAYGSIYGMALFCIVIGSIRSLYYVQKHIRKKRLIETSITENEAKKFPLTASCVLFGLYVFFGYVYFIVKDIEFMRNCSWGSHNTT